ncbi:hypothetical protein [Kitasatospora purpeofusca]|uniref:hypothetical protein n=1 Tax=Kitasatospora purpeofusca TaxID=67352 RepID=UPI002A5A4C90|nr:hypothetical protein [Kitasatospora purpeofusca]MDY0813354.1 hypothetical protein [Kitasatospora purpeofusca]
MPRRGPRDGGHQRWRRTPPAGAAADRAGGGAAAGLRQEIEAFTTTPTSALVR